MAARMFEKLKNKEVTMEDGVMVNSTKMLDGGATEGSTPKDTNTTKQHKTGNIPKGNLGDRNNLDG